MNIISGVGFPKMVVEAGERRVFLPSQMKYFHDRGVKIYLERGYGGYLITDAEYEEVASITWVGRQETFQQDLVMVLRSPAIGEYDLLGKHSILMSMLHYPTRPARVQKLMQLKKRAISLDSIANDDGIRLVENMKAVAWNGLEAAFDYLEKIQPERFRTLAPVQVLVLGTGMVGKHASEAGIKMGMITRYNQAIAENWAGSIAISVGRATSKHQEVMKQLLQSCDILVDATQRRDVSLPVIPNAWLGWLPPHAVVVDLSVDPYDLESDPPSVKGIEGTPQGNLDQYVIEPDDEFWDTTVPSSILSTNRRTSVSCYSWPGIHPYESMLHYEKQLEPLLDTLLISGYNKLSESGTFAERALWRATLEGWVQTNTSSLE